jgi:hypothetical protein
MIDHHTYIGQYPFRHLPHPDADALVRVLDREGVDEAWVGHLPSAFHRDPAAGNIELRDALEPYKSRLRMSPTIRPDWPAWRDELRRARDAGAAAVRAYPTHWSLPPSGDAMRELATTCAEEELCLLLTVRFEDARQRHPCDAFEELSASAIRDLARAGTGARIVVAAAGRAIIEEVHWGVSAEERRSVWWDISWIWGPPENDLAHLLATIGAERFVYGSGWPLRLAQTPRANLALLPPTRRPAILGDPRAR